SFGLRDVVLGANDDLLPSSSEAEFLTCWILAVNSGRVGVGILDFYWHEAGLLERLDRGAGGLATVGAALVLVGRADAALADLALAEQIEDGAVARVAAHRLLVAVQGVL